MSVTAGTIFQDSHVPLTIWFRAMWQITSQKNGISALGLQRVLGLGSYKTAWAMLHKLRRAMVRPGRDRLDGVVEVDETYWGGEETGAIGRQTEDKALDYRRRRGGWKWHRAHPSAHYPGRVQRQPARVHSSRPSSREARSEATAGAAIWGWTDMSMTARCRAIKQEEEHLLPRVHRVISLLKRWLLGTHQGAIGQEHLDDYLDEFTFRFNRRTSKSRGKLFYRLAQQAVQVGPAPFATLVKPQPVVSGGVK